MNNEYNDFSYPLTCCRLNDHWDHHILALVHNCIYSIAITIVFRRVNHFIEEDQQGGDLKRFWSRREERDNKSGVAQQEATSINVLSPPFLYIGPNKSYAAF